MRIGLGHRNLNNNNNLVQEPHLEESKANETKRRIWSKAQEKKSLVLIDFILTNTINIFLPDTFEFP